MKQHYYPVLDPYPLDSLPPAALHCSLPDADDAYDDDSDDDHSYDGHFYDGDDDHYDDDDADDSDYDDDGDDSSEATE